MFAATTAPPSRPSVTARRGAPALVHHQRGPGLRRAADTPDVSLEFVGSAALLALFALPAPARAAETVKISSVTASPASVKPGQAVTFTATMTSSQNKSDSPSNFHWSLARHQHYHHARGVPPLYVQGRRVRE